MRVGEYISRHIFFWYFAARIAETRSLFLANIMKDNAKEKHNRVYFDLLAYKLKKKTAKNCKNPNDRW